MGSGHFEARATVGRHSALREQARAFNSMTQQVASPLQSHRTLTNAVSHELRTSRARLLFSHSLAREESWAEAKDRFLLRMERDIAEIDELTTELLDYAKRERSAPAIGLQSVPAEPWLKDVLADARDDRGRQAAEILSTVDVDSVRCEPRYLARAVVNLLRNALLHARSTVKVSLRRENNRTSSRWTTTALESTPPIASVYSSRSCASTAVAPAIPAGLGSGSPSCARSPAGTEAMHSSPIPPWAEPASRSPGR